MSNPLNSISSKLDLHTLFKYQQLVKEIEECNNAEALREQLKVVMYQALLNEQNFKAAIKSAIDEEFGTK